MYALVLSFGLTWGVGALLPGLTAAAAVLGAVAATWHWAVPLTGRLLLVAGTALLGAVAA